MDKFVVRSKKASLPSSPSKKKRYMRQATLESLKGVVVVEDMERAKVVLERTDTSSQLKVDTLQTLLKKNPSKEVLIRTKLGKTVHKMCRAQDEEVAAAAKQVYKAWKVHILSKVNRPTIEVKCDLRTQNFRNSARRMLTEALQRGGDSGGCNLQSSKEQADMEKCANQSDLNKIQDEEKKPSAHKSKRKEEEETYGRSEKRTSKKQKQDSYTHNNSVELLAEHLEREVYQSSSRLISNSYRRTIRSLVFSLRHQCEMREAVSSSIISVEDFVKQHKKT